MTIAIAFLVLLVTLVIGVPIPLAFFASVAYLILFQGYDPGFLLPHGFAKISSITILAIPLFILAGNLMDKGKIGDKLIGVVEVIAGRFKGGLIVVTVVSCAVFGAISGSSSATMSCIGGIMVPRMRAQGYTAGHCAAIIGNSSLLGLLIPPSMIMILFAWMANQSVLASFLATVIPGVIMVIMLSVVNIFLLRRYPEIQTIPGEGLVDTTKLFCKRGIKATPALLMPVIILGGIYGGVMTPTEAAAVSAVYAMPVGFLIYKGLNRKNFIQGIIESASTTGVIIVMLFAVMILSRVYIMENVPQKIFNILTTISSNKIVILLMINLFLIILGMLVDDISGMMLATPILLPVVTQLGVDPIHFAAMIGVNLGMGNITPPTAPMLYLAGRIGKAQVKDMMMPTMCMILFAWVPVLIMTTYIPNIALFLPRLLLGY